jgi:hypothetical protein
VPLYRAFGFNEIEPFVLAMPDGVRIEAVVMDPTWAKLVRALVDGGQCVADVFGQGVLGGEDVVAGVDLDGAVAA